MTCNLADNGILLSKILEMGALMDKWLRLAG
jgi:hypothetical protein